FVNAPALAEERGLAVRETKVGSARDYVNLVDLRVPYQDRPPVGAGTLYGKEDPPRIVGLDDPIIDVPPSAHMVVVRNDDVPGVIGTVGSILGDAKVNIDDMVVGRPPPGAAALMVLSTAVGVGDDVVAALRSADGII